MESHTHAHTLFDGHRPSRRPKRPSSFAAELLTLYGTAPAAELVSLDPRHQRTSFSTDDFAQSDRYLAVAPPQWEGSFDFESPQSTHYMVVIGRVPGKCGYGNAACRKSL